MKICLECGEGGHLKEMLQIIEALDGHEIFFLIVKVDATKDLQKLSKVYYIEDRPRHNLLYFFCNLVLIIPLCLKVLFIEKPQLIISTGGIATLPISYIGKIMGVKIIYLESLTRVNDLSGTGRLIYPIANLFLVQWSGLITKYNRAKYWGKVI